MEALGPKTEPGLAKVPSLGVVPDVFPLFIAWVDNALFLSLGSETGPFFLALEAILPFLVGVMLGILPQGRFSPIVISFVVGLAP